MALPKMKIKQQCREFSKSGERCKISVVEGMDVCPSHAATLKRDSGQRAPLTASTPKREVLRRVDRALRLGWPDIKFDIRPGINLGGRDILVSLWVNGPTVEEVQEVVAALYSPVTREWGQSKGAPGFECSRSYTPEVFVAALLLHFEKSHKEKSLRAPESMDVKRWTREARVGALDVLFSLSYPENEEFLVEKIQQKVPQLLVMCPVDDHEDGISSFEWLSDITALVFNIVTKK